MNLAYIAGFFDGEGSVGFTRCRSSVYPRVMIVNTNLPVLCSIQRRFGGDIRPLSLRKKGWKVGYVLRLGWSVAVNFLDKISPWVVVKAKQLHTVFAWEAIRPHRGKMTKEEQAVYRDCLTLLQDRMAWLNRKGPSFGTDPAVLASKRKK